METIELPNEILLAQVTEMLSDGVSVQLRAKGNSMLPFIRGDRDSVELHKSDCIKENDIVLARLDNRNYVLHRVIRVEGHNVTLMGDGNVCGTEHCTQDGICGTVFFIIGKNGRRTDCRSSFFLWKSGLWRRLLPFRRYILGVYRRLFRIR